MHGIHYVNNVLEATSEPTLAISNPPGVIPLGGGGVRHSGLEALAAVTAPTASTTLPFLVTD